MSRAARNPELADEPVMTPSSWTALPSRSRNTHPDASPGTAEHNRDRSEAVPPADTGGAPMSEVGLAFPAGVVNVVDAAEVEERPWQPLRGLAGVNHKVVWRSKEMIVGLVRIDPGAAEPGHAHADAQHH